jgi:predicted DNA-binding protein with PD1-like motif
MRSLEVEGGYLVRLEAGERLPDALVEFCRAKGVASATVEGLGALADVELGYYDLGRKTYDRKTLPGSWELLSLFADVATWEGEPFAHTHVVLSGPDFTARGGHLFGGTVSVTAELRVWPLGKPLARRSAPEFGLHFLDL